MTKLGQIIFSVRSKRNMSLQDVGDEAGITKAHVWDIETGKSRNPTVKTLLGLGFALEVNPIKLAGAAIEDLPGVRSK